MSVDDVAAHLGVRRDSVYRWIDRRGLPARKLGKLWKLKLSEVDDWVHRCADAVASGGMRAAFPSTAGDASARPRGRVLVVDDDEIVREALHEFLTDEGYDPVTAADGADALRLLRSGEPPPDVILLDLGMPTMDGRHFLEEQARDGSLASVPVIVVTAERHANVPGAAAVLRKPLDLDRLAAAIDGASGAGGT